MAAKKKTTDWERIERDFRSGVRSVKEIARQNGISDTAIRKRAKRDGWTRDLTRDVRAATQSKLVRDEVRGHNAKTDAEIVEAAAAESASVVRSHRKDIREGRDVATLLMRELQSNTVDAPTLAQLIDQAADDEDWPAQRRSAIERAVSLPQRTACLRDLSQAMHKLQALERQAYNIDGRATDKDPLEQLLEAVTDTSRGLDGYEGD